MLIVLDTHAWVWWVSEDPRLSKKARAAIDAAVRGDGVALSVIVVASARHYQAVLVTKDAPLRRYPHVQTLW